MRMRERGFAMAAAAGGIVVALGAGGRSALASGVDYVLDDGSGGAVIGPSAFDAWLTWGNVFDVAPGGELINEVSVSFGTGFDVGREIKITIFDDPTDDLDPRDAVALTVVDAVTRATTVDTFATYAIPETAVSGTFFVAVSLDARQGEAFARQDQSTPGVRSWYFFDGVFNTDLGTQGLAVQNTQGPFPGTWMVRAGGVPTPGALGVLLIAGGMVVRRRR
ncbi:MAG: hypothetical protein AAFP26_06450 [Planctomycetota bacterium]